MDAAPAILLLSGGLDSYTAGAIAKAEGFRLFALTVRYGQTHVQEIEASRRAARALGVERHVELDLDLRDIARSALTGAGAVPLDRDVATAHDIPSTYVPARNTIFLSLALAWAETVGASDIVIGVNALDYSGYPDCRPEYVAAYEVMARLATAAGVGGRPLRIHAPLQHLTKADIIRRGLALGLDYGLTHSCYAPTPDGRPCGRCDSCQLRARGFADAGVPDPALRPAAPDSRFPSPDSRLPTPDSRLPTADCRSVMPPTTTFAVTDAEIASAYPVMRQLRPHLDEAAFVERVRAAERLGLRLVLHADRGRVVAVAGFRLLEQLKNGLVLYVDDLVTDEGERSKGHGDALLHWLVAYAREQGCVAFELDSGVQRHGAHRFYLRHRMRISAYHFVIDL